MTVQLSRFYDATRAVNQLFEAERAAAAKATKEYQEEALSSALGAFIEVVEGLEADLVRLENS